MDEGWLPVWERPHGSRSSELLVPSAAGPLPLLLAEHADRLHHGPHLTRGLQASAHYPAATLVGPEESLDWAPNGSRRRARIRRRQCPQALRQPHTPSPSGPSSWERLLLGPALAEAIGATWGELRLEPQPRSPIRSSHAAARGDHPGRRHRIGGIAFILGCS